MSSSPYLGRPHVPAASSRSWERRSSMSPSRHAYGNEQYPPESLPHDEYGAGAPSRYEAAAASAPSPPRFELPPRRGDSDQPAHHPLHSTTTVSQPGSVMLIAEENRQLRKQQEALIDRCLELENKLRYAASPVRHDVTPARHSPPSSAHTGRGRSAQQSSPPEHDDGRIADPPQPRGLTIAGIPTSPPARDSSSSNINDGQWQAAASRAQADNGVLAKRVSELEELLIAAKAAERAALDRAGAAERGVAAAAASTSSPYRQTAPSSSSSSAPTAVASMDVAASGTDAGAQQGNASGGRFAGLKSFFGGGSAPVGPTDGSASSGPGPGPSTSLSTGAPAKLPVPSGGAGLKPKQPVSLPKKEQLPGGGPPPLGGNFSAAPPGVEATSGPTVGGVSMPVASGTSSSSTGQTATAGSSPIAGKLPLPALGSAAGKAPLKLPGGGGGGPTTGPLSSLPSKQQTAAQLPTMPQPPAGLAGGKLPLKLPGGSGDAPRGLDMPSSPPAGPPGKKQLPPEPDAVARGVISAVAPPSPFGGVLGWLFRGFLWLLWRLAPWIIIVALLAHIAADKGLGEAFGSVWKVVATVRWLYSFVSRE